MNTLFRWTPLATMFLFSLYIQCQDATQRNHTIEEQANRMVKMQTELEKKVSEATRPIMIRFYTKYYDKIQQLRKEFNPLTDGEKVSLMWNEFTKENLEPIMQVVEPILKESIGNNEQAFALAKQIFRKKFSLLNQMLQEQFLIETEAHKMRD